MKFLDTFLNSIKKNTILKYLNNHIFSINAENKIMFAERDYKA